MFSHAVVRSYIRTDRLSVSHANLDEVFFNRWITYPTSTQLRDQTSQPRYQLDVGHCHIKSERRRIIDSAYSAQEHEDCHCQFTVPISTRDELNLLSSTPTAWINTFLTYSLRVITMAATTMKLILTPNTEACLVPASMALSCRTGIIEVWSSGSRHESEEKMHRKINIWGRKPPLNCVYFHEGPSRSQPDEAEEEKHQPLP